MTDQPQAELDHYTRKAYGNLLNRYDQLAFKHGRTLQLFDETTSHLHQLKRQVKDLESKLRHSNEFIAELQRAAAGQSLMNALTVLSVVGVTSLHFRSGSPYLIQLERELKERGIQFYSSQGAGSSTHFRGIELICEEQPTGATQVGRTRGKS